MHLLLPSPGHDWCDSVSGWDHLAGARDKMSLRIMWLPLRYKEVNYTPWFIIWKLKTHSFSNLIPPSMEQCSLWAKLANNVTNSDADVISIWGAAARRDERVPDGSLPLLSPPSRQFPSSCDNNLGNKGGRGSASLFHSLRWNHLILNVIVFLSFPVSLCLKAADNRRKQFIRWWRLTCPRPPNWLKDCRLFWMNNGSRFLSVSFFFFFCQVTRGRMTWWTTC